MVWQLLCAIGRLWAPLFTSREQRELDRYTAHTKERPIDRPKPQSVQVDVTPSGCDDEAVLIGIGIGAAVGGAIGAGTGATIMSND